MRFFLFSGSAPRRIIRVRSYIIKSQTKNEKNPGSCTRRVLVFVLNQKKKKIYKTLFEKPKPLRVNARLVCVGAVRFVGSERPYKREFDRPKGRPIRVQEMRTIVVPELKINSIR